MKTAIIYMSKHGTTEKIAEIIKSKLEDQEVHIFNLKKTKPVDLNDFDTIIIGGSVYVGAVQKKLRKYVADNLSILLLKKIALFLVCMDKTEKRKEFFANAFTAELRDRSIADGFPGGEFNFGRMNFLERAIIRKITGKSSDISEIDYQAIDEFTGKVNTLRKD